MSLNELEIQYKTAQRHADLLKNIYLKKGRAIWSHASTHPECECTNHNICNHCYSCYER